MIRRLIPMVALAAAFGWTVWDAKAQDVSARPGTSLTIGGRVQAQMEVNSSPDVPASFFLRRVWVTLDGRVSDLVSGRVQFNADGSNVFEAWLGISPSPAFQLTIGQLKRGVSYFWLAPNFDLALIERDGRVTGVDHCPGVGGVCSFGQITLGLGLSAYEPGVRAQGRSGNGRLGYLLTVTNGEGIGRRDVNAGKSISGRLSTYFGEDGRLSVYGALDETLGSRKQTITMPAGGLELEIGTWRKGPHLLASAVAGSNWKVDDDAKFVAAQLMGLWYRDFGPDASLAGIEPLLRLSWMRTDAPAGGSESGFLATPGVMLYLAGRNGISTNLDIYGSGDRRDWSLKVQAFAHF